MAQDSFEETAFYILKNMRRVAVVGCSREQGKPSHDVPEYLKSAGYKIIPVNPYADEILGEKAYGSLLEIPVVVEVVDVFRPAREASGIAKQAKQIGAKALWLQEGIFSAEARDFAKENCMLYVENRCMMQEHIKLTGGGGSG